MTHLRSNVRTPLSNGRLVILFKAATSKNIITGKKAIKQYFKGQRELNGLTDDFDWRTGNKSLVERTINILSFFRHDCRSRGDERNRLGQGKGELAKA